jgi:hypothetical protein
MGANRTRRIPTLGRWATDIEKEEDKHQDFGGSKSGGNSGD